MPNGEEITLYRHDRDFSITIGSMDLMHSRQHESEFELARLGCMHIERLKKASVLIGGLGMGYTLRMTLDMLGPLASVTVMELLPAVVEWNREFLGELTKHPLTDTRVELNIGDVFDSISRSNRAFDAIMLDVDNGPKAISAAGNERLYGANGISACRRALTESGCLSVWSAEADPDFEQILLSAGLHARRYRVPAYHGSKSQSRFVWVACANKLLLPAGGGECWTKRRR